jgi:predicted RNase H-like HicB family nuclease
MTGTTSIEYTAHIWQEEAQYIAHAMPWDVISAGPSPDEARKALDEAVHLFLVTAADMGTLEDVLHESGYEFRQGGWVSPAWVAIERHSTVVTV